MGIVRIVLTQSIVPLVIIVLTPATAQVLQDHGYVTEDNEWWREHWPFMKGHDELVSLELPNLIGDGLHFKEGVTTMTYKRSR